MLNGNKVKTKLALREIVTASIVVVGAIGALIYTNQSNPTISADGVSYSIEVADDFSERQLGLSGRSSIDDDEGMLFVFEEPGLHGFWMKDMNFSIDMLWLNKSGEIVHIENNVSPETYPEVFYPSTAASYVFEIGAGRALETGLGLGDTLDISL